MTSFQCHSYSDGIPMPTTFYMLIVIEIFDVNNEMISAKVNGNDMEQQKNNSPQQPIVLISGSRDRTIRVWDVSAATCLFTLYGHDNWVRGIRLHPNGKLLGITALFSALQTLSLFIVSVSDDKTMRIWSLEHRRYTKVLQAHPQFVTCIGSFLVDLF